jgi:RimJ/RimL family protein N-acetyltransferase
MLTGEKVRLRALEREDLDLRTAWDNDVELQLAANDVPPRPRSRLRRRQRFDEQLKHDHDLVAFMIEVDGKPIGECSLANFDQVARTCELGIAIGDRDYQGRGYGRDAMRLLIAYGFRSFNLHKIWLEVGAGNERAVHVYRACGFVEEGRLRQQWYQAGKFVDVVLMGLLRADWRAAGEPEPAPVEPEPAPAGRSS